MKIILSGVTYIVGLRTAAHTTRFEKWDVYGGLIAGYQFTDVRHTASASGEYGNKIDTEPSHSPPAEDKFIYSGFVGASYYPVERLGVFGEAGFGISILNLGIQVKLK